MSDFEDNAEWGASDETAWDDDNDFPASTQTKSTTSSSSASQPISSSAASTSSRNNNQLQQTKAPPQSALNDVDDMADGEVDEVGWAQDTDHEAWEDADDGSSSISTSSSNVAPANPALVRTASGGSYYSSSSYQILDVEQLKEKADNMCKSVSEILDISLQDAASLLKNYG
jgi:hypothetical protein